ncbi:MAG: precorrin-6y C5,15-methyltransferase (decarboxylating) subunit CbiE [Prevotella sp.]|uniref:precorrin-6y C5,15-methyltransferase (decarboxylating) subunit CbiE n=1 Tax=Prevotella sp. TaxID=59823 RepID=UPI002A25CEFD|nr:precorrin-6y C5,15-methyltransferase (decarboxylating) subunit CbiE [Prevotella sp.]MDD7318967.1 precorrin-6y C5,15-methyltransferase (decarboxylating) subunit CbiE [Prevotellaceae bacterium]MDY4019993.1 precorrin-6y C5,15-methyltransferase (decarboxylating) subunit CbiE [Prevotella sp.]
MTERRADYIVIGIDDSHDPSLSRDALQAIASGRVFSGGKRHHDIVAHLLPAGARWIDITVPLDDVFAEYEKTGDTIVVFASGDPLFFGFAATIQRRIPGAVIKTMPTLNSLQTLAHRLLLPYHDMQTVTLTGRPWHEFDTALIRRMPKIGVLTDRNHTPAAIARRMLEYGYDNYVMHIGELLGNDSGERVGTFSLEEAAEYEALMPNCVIITAVNEREKMVPIPDAEFLSLPGRPLMITKAPIRHLTLAALELQHRRSLWDIGFCTGSVSIEARQQFPQLHVTSFETRSECEDIINTNMRRLGTPGINISMGDFLDADTSAYPDPDAVFIGGHGGHLREIILKAAREMTPGGVIVYNCVAVETTTDPRIPRDSIEIFNNAAAEAGLTVEQPLRVAIDLYHPINILKARKK